MHSISPLPLLTEIFIIYLSGQNRKEGKHEIRHAQAKPPRFTQRQNQRRLHTRHQARHHPELRQKGHGTPQGSRPLREKQDLSPGHVQFLGSSETPLWLRPQIGRRGGAAPLREDSVRATKQGRVPAQNFSGAGEADRKQKRGGKKYLPSPLLCITSNLRQRAYAPSTHAPFSCTF